MNKGFSISAADVEPPFIGIFAVYIDYYCKDKLVM
jgi:hypothetical protein